MNYNEGKLGEFNFGGEVAHTTDHPPVFATGMAKGNLKTGMILAREGADIVANDGSKPVIGVCSNDVDAGTGKSISYLIHGTVKREKLKKADNTAFTDVSKIVSVGIYPVN